MALTNSERQARYRQRGLEARRTLERMGMTSNANEAAGSTFDFGGALAWLKAGQKVARQGWNGKDMFLFLVPGSHFKVNRPPLLGIYPEGTGIDYRPHIDMKTAQGDVVPWVASQSDLLSDDWVLVE